MNQDAKLLKEAYGKVTKLDEFAFPSRGGNYKSDGELADNVVKVASRIAGLSNRDKLTFRSKDLQQIYFDLVNLLENIETTTTLR